MKEAHQVKDRDIQVIIGNLLRYGVWTALGVALVGGIVYLSRHAQDTIQYGSFTEQNHTIVSVLWEAISGTSQGQGRDIILLGIILLFLTPILRVIFSLIAFFLEKDYLYVGITALVILIICFSIFFGFSH